jgi:hypothetical protein
VIKCYGQGHWAYGRVGSDLFGAKPRGGNNNDILFYDWERLSGSNPRHGGLSRVKIAKI